MNRQIKFKAQEHYLGRNGYGIQIGVDLYRYDDRKISLTPINTKGLARCEISIPLVCLDEFIQALTDLKAQNLTTMTSEEKNDLEEKDKLIKSILQNFHDKVSDTKFHVSTYYVWKDGEMGKIILDNITPEGVEVGPDWDGPGDHTELISFDQIQIERLNFIRNCFFGPGEWLDPII
jgi:hypothetical protein